MDRENLLPILKNFSEKQVDQILNAAKGNSLEQYAPSSSFRSTFSRFELEADGQTDRNAELIDLDNTQQTLSPLTASIGIDERPHGAVSMNWDQRPVTPASTADISLGISVNLLSSSTPQPASDSSTTSSNPPQPSSDSSTTSSNPPQPFSDSSTTSYNPPQPSDIPPMADPCSCKLFKCHERLNKKSREEIHAHFWALSYESRRAFILINMCQSDSKGVAAHHWFKLGRNHANKASRGSVFVKLCLSIL